MSKILEINKSQAKDPGKLVDDKMQELNRELSDWLMTNINRPEGEKLPDELIYRAWTVNKIAELHVLFDLMDVSITNLTTAIKNMSKVKK